MPANNTLNILCIEDNAGEARLIERHLTRAGYIMTWAKSGGEGLARQLEENFDVVLIDHLLPDMKGLAVLQKLLERQPHLPVIMVTAHGDEETAVAAMKLGAKDYIIKDTHGGFIELLPAVIEQVYRQYTIFLEKQRAEAALYQAQKLESIGLLAGGIAHEFNNLLTGILNQTSLSLYKIPTDSTARPHLEKVFQTSEQAAHLVKQLLGYAGQGQYVVEPLNLNDILNENIGLFNSISRARIRFNLELAPELPTVEADKSQVQQAIMNLIINATESIKKTDGLVQISTSDIFATEPLPVVGQQVLEAGRYVCLKVKDNGSGIQPELLSKIFDPFFSTKANGRGLGLSATLGIIKAHAGGLWVESQVGRGTEFQVYLPASRKAARVRSEMQSDRGYLEASILLIDDEPSVLEPIKDGLEMVGARVFVAKNGLEGIEIYEQYHREIDLIILDMIMPGMDGRETFLHLQKIDPDLKVILSSGYSEVEALRQFAEHEIILFLKKPYRFEKLINEINQALH